MSDRYFPRRLATLLLGLSLACAAGPPASGPAGGSGASASPAAAPPSSDPDDLLVVDCLLPARIRKLGSKVTYLAPRRPLKTSRIDCEIRGGEYVSYDRADYRVALRIWMESAQQGDAAAQNYVGEIYERGLGVPPDYANARLWYEKAAAQGYAPAQTNLGQLYERGLGVTQDMNRAVAYYRTAAGMTEEAFVASTPDTSQVESLRAELAKSHRETEAMRRQLETLQSDLAAAQAKRSRVAGERDALAEARDALETERQAIARARAELERTGGELTTAAKQRERELAARSQAVEQREREMQGREAAFVQKKAELEKLDREIAALREEAERRRAEVTQVAQNVASSVPGPSIQLIDPKPGGTRGESVMTVAAGVGERNVVGRVDAPGGLLSVTVNDRPAEVNENGIFQHRVTLSGPETQVSIVAIDKLGKREDAALRFQVVEAAGGTRSAQPAAPQPKLPEISFGSYHALVIGNNAYQSLPRLKTARADAEAVADLLEQRYGFQVVRLFDANRYQILSALNELRGRLTDEDNLLIYYAGHGVLDEVNSRGHWQPVDAEAESSANWISNVALTDVLNAMNAKHILVVADSCYSGTLTRSSLARLEAGMTRTAKFAWQRTMAQKRSRTALTSGGLAPVLDAGGGGHSIFAKAFMQVLESNNDVIEGQRLFQEISALVTWAAQARRFEQVPQYAPIKYAGHESGDFFLVPKPTT